MAWASVQAMNSGNEKVAGTTLIIGSFPTVVVGHVILVITAWDNTDTTDVNPTRLSVADDVGNTYVRIREFVNGQGASNAGSHVGILYSIVTTQLNNGQTITITNDTSKTARGATLHEFSFGADSTISIVSPTDLADDGADPGSMTISGLASAERLYVRGIAREAAAASLTATTNFTKLSDANSYTTGGGAASNMGANAEFRINTSTGETSDPTVASGDCASIFVALEEVTAAAERVPRSTPYPQLLAH